MQKPRAVPVVSAHRDGSPHLFADERHGWGEAPKGKRLGRAFYRQPAPELAPRLLGKWLCRRSGRRTLRLRITETEAYYGEADTACHARRGRTPRTDIMYAAGGHAYIYLCYGMHEMLNVVSGAADFPEAVLIRGVEGADGPGRLTRALGITRGLNREDLTVSKRLWIEDDGTAVAFTTAPRIGIAYASARDRRRRWRFAVAPCAQADAVIHRKEHKERREGDP